MREPDGDVVCDFQTIGLDARVWELYRHASGSRSGHYKVSRPHDRPDFLFARAGAEAWIEAVTPFVQEQGS